MRLTTLLSCLVAATIATPAGAAAIFEITEAYQGVSGPDGTADWFELTNMGDMIGSTSGLFYDDDSDDPTKNTPLPALSLAPGESAVILLEALAADVVDFQGIWGAGFQVAAMPVAGKLGGGGDQVNVYDGNTAGAGLIDSASYGGSFEDTLRTIEFTAAGVASSSTLGVNGAYASVPFENAGLALPPGNTIQLIGSPGFAVTVPEPTTALLLVIGVAGFVARPRV